MARNEAPGLFREGFAFERLPSFRAAKFKELKEEWWHYTLKDEPFPNQYFDFNIE